MALSMGMRWDIFSDLEKKLKYRFWDKERERRDHAVQYADQGPKLPVCPMRHEVTAWSGPLNDTESRVESRYVCLTCYADATASEIRARGHDFETVQDRWIKQIMDEKLRRKFILGDPKTFIIAKR